MASQDSYALKVGERILVTGANGFIGSNVVDVLLSLGYIVRGAVRSEKPWLNELFKSKYGGGKFETVNLPTLDDKEALAAALDSVSGIVHVVCKIDHLRGCCEILTLEIQASDTSFGPDPNIINHVVATTEAVLEAAARVPSIKRVVLTSSSVSAVVPYPGEGRIELTQGKPYLFFLNVCCSMTKIHRYMERDRCSGSVGQEHSCREQGLPCLHRIQG